MNIQDFDTAVRYKLPMTIVVSNNEGWTARVKGIRKPAGNWDTHSSTKWRKRWAATAKTWRNPRNYDLPSNEQCRQAFLP